MPPGSRHLGQRSVVILALDDAILFDLATPVEVFGRVVLGDGSPGYDVVVAGPSPEVRTGAVGLRVPHGMDALTEADLVVVPGRNDPTRPTEPLIAAALNTASGRGATVASICVGAFVLADAGLLNGRRATTHWAAAADLARRYPQVDVDPSVLYVGDGPIFTSAGAAAGLDLCLHLVARDHGAAAAAAAARQAVVPLVRAGGQAQFIPPSDPAGNAASLAPTLQWLEQQACFDVSLSDIADHAGLTPRTLHRRFRHETGMSPVQWVARTRVRHAQRLLETTDAPVEDIAHHVGFGSATQLRTMFARVTATTPTAYRAAMNTNT